MTICPRHHYYLCHIIRITMITMKLCQRPLMIIMIMCWISVRTNIRIYSNIFLRILIFVFNSWQFSKPNIIRIFEYFCMNISEYWSLKITWNTWIKEFYFPFLTWRYILTTLLITMIISCWSVNPLDTGHLCKAELSMLFRKIFHLCITNYSKIFEYFELFEY